MNDELRQIAYNEGYEAHVDKVSISDDPYEGVSPILSTMWWEGWWDAFYDE